MARSQTTRGMRGRTRRRATLNTMEDLDHRHVHDARRDREITRRTAVNPLRCAIHASPKPWVTIGLRFPATPKPGVAILGHPARRILRAPGYPSNACVRPMGAAGKNFLRFSLSCIAQKARWFAIVANPAVACDGPVFSRLRLITSQIPLFRFASNGPGSLVSSFMRFSSHLTPYPLLMTAIGPSESCNRRDSGLALACRTPSCASSRPNKTRVTPPGEC